ncbi:MAG: hypothetical protein IKM48_05885 [Clostridia bacterium]|nr:hypothetical protein [Clostridia bacterium]
MIFSTEIEKICAYCEHGKPICGTDDIICPKKGIVRADHSCKKFLYSPLRRTPPKPFTPDFKGLEMPKLDD